MGITNVESLVFTVPSDQVARGVTAIKGHLSTLERQIDQTFRKFEQFAKGLNRTFETNTTRRHSSVEAAESRHQLKLEQIQRQAAARQAQLLQQRENQLAAIRARSEAAEQRHAQRLAEIQAQGARRGATSGGFGLGGLIGAGVAFGVGRTAIDSAGSVQNIQRAFENLDKGGAGNTLERLRKQADAASLSFIEYANQVNRVRSTQKLTADQSERLVLGLTNVRRAVGATLEQQDRAVTALNQILNKNKVQAEELRGQLLESIPNLAPIIEKRFGTLDAEKLEKKFGARKFVAGLIEELDKAKKLDPTPFERFQKATADFKLAAAPLGELLLTKLTPGMQGLAKYANEANTAFKGLSPETQTSLVNFGILATVSGLVAANFGRIVGFALSLKSTLPGIAAGLLLEPLLRTPEEDRKHFESVRQQQIQREIDARRRSDPNFDRGGIHGPEVSFEHDPSLSPVGKLRAGVREKLLARAAGGGVTGGGGSGAHRQSEAEQLTERLKGLNKEIGDLQTRTSPEYKLKLQIEGAEDTRKQLSELLELQDALGFKRETPTRVVQVGKGKTRGILDRDKLGQQLDTLREIKGRAGVGTDFGGLTAGSFQIAIEAESIRLKEQGDVLEKQAKVADFLADTAANLTDQLESLGINNNVDRERQRLRKANIAFDSPDAENVLGLARQLDQQEKAQRAYADALEESTRRTEEFHRVTESLLETLLTRPRDIFRQLQQLATQFAAKTLNSVLFGGGGSGSGGGFGGGGQASGGGLFGAVSSIFTGGGGGGGGSLFRTPGFNPGASGGGSGGASFGGFNLGGMLGRIPGLGGLFNRGAVGGWDAATAAERASGAAGGLGSLAALGPAALVAGGGLLGSLAGGSSQFGRLLGGIGGSLLAFNPIIGGALIGGALLVNKLSNRTEKALGKLIQSEYHIKTDLDTQKQVKAIGDQQFRGDGGAKRHQLDTIRLRPTKELLYDYALNSGQYENKLVREFELERQLGNSFFSGNRIEKRASGGRVMPGRDYLIGERQAEVVRFDSPGMVYPSLSDYASRAGGGGAAEAAATRQMLQWMTGVIADLSDQVARLQSMPFGHALAIGSAENPQGLATGARRGFALNVPEQVAYNQANGF